MGGEGVIGGVILVMGGSSSLTRMSLCLDIKIGLYMRLIGKA